MEKVLAKVEAVRLHIEDHGILTLDISLDYGGSGQGFGGRALCSPNSDLGRREGSASGLDYILLLLQLFEVDELDKIVGRTVYALKEGDGWNSLIIGLQLPDFDGGNKFLVQDWIDKWFPNNEEVK